MASVSVRVVEDCVGLGTAFKALKHAVRKCGLSKKLKLLLEWASESDDHLFKFAKKNYTRVVKCSSKTSKKKFDKVLGTNGQVAIYIGGAECQAFSKQGIQKGKKDPRSLTTRSVLKSIRRRKPLMFLLEQVDNIISMTHREFFDKYIIRALNGITVLKGAKLRRLYRVQYRVLDTKDFGVPQSRKRLYLLGTRRDVKALRSLELPLGDKSTPTLKNFLGTCKDVVLSTTDLNPTERRNLKIFPLELKTDFPPALLI